MGAKEDDDYWNEKYAEASCHEHGADPMEWDSDAAEWFCVECDELGDIYKYG